MVATPTRTTTTTMGVDDSSDVCPGHDDNVDTDGDGIPDGCDGLTDSDGDGVADSADVCPGHDDNVDTDGDGIPDGCDGLTDSDGDGVADSADVCPGFDDNVDTDGDGTPDGCEIVARRHNPDPDGDGIEGDRDNCPYAYNPDQEDGWGSAMGDACDTDWYNRTGQGVSGFVQKNGIFHLHGNCTYLADGSPRCPLIAAFDPTTFDSANMPMEITSDHAGTWSIWVHYLHSNHGADVYQVNVYSTNPPQPDTLVDDQLEIHVRGGSWQWHHRGGHPDYNGI